MAQLFHCVISNNQNSMIRLPVRMGFYSKAKNSICLATLADPVMKHWQRIPHCVNEDQMLNIFIGVAQLLALARWQCAALTCISRTLKAHHTSTATNLKIFLFLSLVKCGRTSLPWPQWVSCGNKKTIYNSASLFPLQRLHTKTPPPYLSFILEC